MSKAFLQTIKNAGYLPGMYTNIDFGNSYFSNQLLASNYLWLAQYSNTCTSTRDYMMWQYTENGLVDGISGKVDKNYTYLLPEGYERFDTGWVNVNNKWYYLNSNGEMAVNTIVDGWKIDSNGVATPLK